MWVKRTYLTLAACAWLTFVSAPSLRADNLVADISEDQIAISSNFTGKRLVLFGAIDRTSAGLTDIQNAEGIRDVIVVIRGPNENMMVRRKERKAGIWVNSDAVEFEKVPSYYFVASNRDFDAIAEDSIYRLNAIGSDNLRMKPISAELSEDVEEEYKQAIIRNMQNMNLFFEQPGAVQFLDQTLFRTTVDLPATVPVGIYKTKVYLLRDGKIVSVQSKPLYINKTGLERSIFEFAHDEPFWYGVLAVLFAFGAGWLASLIFRQD